MGKAIPLGRKEKLYPYTFQFESYMIEIIIILGSLYTGYLITRREGDRFFY